MSRRRTAIAVAAIPIAALLLFAFSAPLPLAAQESPGGSLPSSADSLGDTLIILRGESVPGDSTAHVTADSVAITSTSADSLAPVAAETDSLASPAADSMAVAPLPDSLAAAPLPDSLASAPAVDSVAVADSLAANAVADSLAAGARADSLANLPTGPPPFFAVVAYDSAASSWGVACATPEIACGARLMAARAGAGAVASLGPGPAPLFQAMAALAGGASADSVQEVLHRALEDPAARQNLIVAKNGRVTGISGTRLPRYSGVILRNGFACAGYALHGHETLEAMAAAYAGSDADLASRLVGALDAADRMENRPFRSRRSDASAAVLVVRMGADPKAGTDRLADLRVDWDPDPVAALHRLTARHAETFLAAAHVRFGDEARRAGETDRAKREYAAAEAGFRAAVARAPEDPDALNELAWFLATRGSDAAEALHFAERAVVARSDDPNLYDTLAEAAYHAGDLERAVDAAERAAELGRGNARYGERLRFFQSAREARAPSTR
jgi:uncharacterized Ntn-hydrolase superfamily protein